MDEFTAVFTYISGLDIDDIDSLQSRSRGKAVGEGSGPTSPVSDEEFAFLLFAQEAQALLNITKDHIVTTRKDGDNPSRSLVEELAAIEEMARHDRQMAIALSEGREPPRRQTSLVSLRAAGLPHSEDIEPFTALEDSAASVASSSAEELQSSSTSSPPVLPSETVDILIPCPPSPVSSASKSLLPATLPPIDLSPTSILTSKPAEGSSSPGGNAVTVTPTETCIICSDIIEESVVRMPCGHTCDTGCLNNMFRTASVDESVFPPRCCQTAIPLDEVRHHLGPTVAETFQTKSLEFNTANRVYCHRPTCSAFLGAATIAPSLLSCTCSAKTCGSCKEEAHPNQGCSPPSDQVVLGLAKKNGWQRCPGCFHLVELFLGCHHMECICKKQFCYLCGVTWKGCSCPQFAEEHLILAE
ncbi:hypothetical protein SCP_0110420 [Sparassis crispa]|uniref:RBR-type E3 ubiquitin transferase n=1 Tax=Sparassis crispa TaxID=139825 RepID=A0A401G7M9_9APHY|nr:hypothetical protein SCP_0110420 [Sparassis crispa]GBE78159.1 hypothetical protein SCP_0110420 [Sparassis crispa]